jgi:hypothetical protein
VNGIGMEDISRYMLEMEKRVGLNRLRKMENRPIFDHYKHNIFTASSNFKSRAPNYVSLDMHGHVLAA